MEHKNSSSSLSDISDPSPKNDPRADPKPDFTQASVKSEQTIASTPSSGQSSAPLSLATTEMKLEFIKDELKKRNYSSDVFQNYMQSQKSADLSQWTMSELEELMQEFKVNYLILLETYLASIKNFSSSDDSDSSSDEKQNLSIEIGGLESEKFEELPTTPMIRESIRRIGDVPKDASIDVKVKTEKPTINLEIKDDILEENRPSFIEPIFNVPKEELDEEEIQHNRSATLPNKTQQLEEEFQKRLNKVQTPKSSPESSDEEKNPIQIHVDTTPKKEPQKEQMPALYTDVYKVESIWLADNELSMKTCEVIISDPEKNNHIITYTVSTIPLGWVVKRHLNDFLLLRNVLITVYPAVYVPPPLPKKLLGKNSDDTVLKHQRFLQRFMHSTISHPLLKRSPFLMEFLKEDDEEKFENFKKQAVKAKKPEEVNHMATPDGLAYCDGSDSHEYVKNLSEYLNSAQNIQKSIKRQSNKVEEQLKATSAVIMRLAESVKDLERLQDMLPNNQMSSNTFREFHQVLGSWARSDLERIKTVKEYMSTFFKYAYNEVTPLKDLIKERENWFQNYIKAEKKLVAKKEKLWAQGDVNKWEIEAKDLSIDIAALQENKELAFQKMLTQETKRVEKIKDMYAFYNYKLQEEMLWFLPYSSTRTVKQLAEYAKKETSTAWRLKQAWESFAEKLSQLEGGTK